MLPIAKLLYLFKLDYVREKRQKVVQSAIAWKIEFIESWAEQSKRVDRVERKH